jgi:hypothetical protein
MTEWKSQGERLRTEMFDLIVAYVKEFPGSTNAEVATGLSLETASEGGQHRNYLTHSLLADAVRRGALARTKDGKNVRYAPYE